MNLSKLEYQNVLALLARVELKGIAEAKEAVSIALKLEAKIANWIDGDINTIAKDVKADTAAVEKVL